MKLDRNLIAKRERTLKAANKHLKEHFIGIDDIIDKFINSIKIWYILPEIQTRPLIINLWGITGVGKTDLVRKFVKFIEYSDRFTEIQMNSQDGTATIEDYLETTMESSETQGILLLDEIQRFRTVSGNGEETNSSKFQDLWMLLSDGTFQSNAKLKQDLMRMILEDDYWADVEQYNPDDEEEEVASEASSKKTKAKTKKRKYLTSPWEAGRLKKLLKLTEPTSEIMQWDEEKKVNLIKAKLNSSETYEGNKYEKLLIIISGNLDEAFRMAGAVNDADLDADVYHEYSKSIDIINIKGALRERFKPEQIARLGNVHLIYPIPNKAAYTRIIEQKVKSIVENVRKTNDIIIKVDDTITKVIYDNGVFPTQGVRPVISTVSSILENSLPKFLFEYLKAESNNPISLTYRDGYIHSVIEGKKVKYEIPTVLDDIKEKQTIDNKALVSVHEAGHAITYVLLHKTVPTQIVAATADEDAEGFVGVHQTIGAKSQVTDDIIITLAGRAAEELVFGPEVISKGASSDLAHATSNAAGMIRFWAMTDNIGWYLPTSKSEYHKVSLAKTDDAIEKILKEQYAKTLELVEKNMTFLLEVADGLMEKSQLSQEEFKEIAQKYIKGRIAVVDAGDALDVPYKKMLDKKKKES